MRIFVLFAILVFGFGSIGNACESLRKDPHRFVRSWEKYRNESLRKYEFPHEEKVYLIAYTAPNDSGKNTYNITKSEVDGKLAGYIVFQVNENCEKTDHFTTEDVNIINNIIREKGMKRRW